MASFGGWLFEHEAMTVWLREDEGSKILWLKGIPGAGKQSYPMEQLLYWRRP
jgi:hypothetical protein